MDLPSIKSELYDYEFVPGDLQDLVQWCRRQADFYDLVLLGSSRLRGELNLNEARSQCEQLSYLGTIGDQLERLIPRADNDEPTPELDQLMSELKNKINLAFGQYKLPPAESEIALNLKALMEKDPSVGLPAIFSLIRYNGYQSRQFSQWHPEIWRGLGIGAMLSAQSTLQRKPENYASAYREMVSNSQAELARTRKKVELTLSNLKKDVSAFSLKTVSFDEAYANRLDQTEKITAKTISDVTQEIADFKTFVKKEIALKEPVTYWRDKANAHQNVAMGFGILSVALMCLFAGTTYYFAKEITSFAGTNYVGLALVGVIVTLAFWMLRLCVRIFLGQQHMASDGKERVAMVTTYLALHEAGLAPKDGDLTPVLVALFRPSTDGMVKDEAMPPVLAEILTRTKP